MGDVADVSDVLLEAATWLDSRGIPLWSPAQCSPEYISADVTSGSFVIAHCDGIAAGVMRFTWEDPHFWPDVPQGQSAFIHRLAVRRSYAGGELSQALLQWAVEETRRRGRLFLRLDCAADRPNLRAVYERFGFQYHSDRQVGPYLVARYEFPVA